MCLKAVIKIGGSLSRGSGLNALCSEIARLGERYRLLVVPGGGGFADQVRKSCRRYALDDTTAHHMALLAMDQYGYVLGRLIGGSFLSADVRAVRSAADKGRAAVLLPSSLIMESDPLPHSWEVTSDTIAAWLSQKVNCPLLILLKDVDGLLAVGEDEGFPHGLIPDLTVRQLDGHHGGVDGYLARFLASTHLETWVINGRHPERLANLLGTGRTIGTRIVPPARP